MLDDYLCSYPGWNTIRRGLLHLPLVSCSAAEVEAVPWPDAASTATPLFQVGAGGPHSGVVSHVVVGGEQLYLGPVSVVAVHGV